MALFIIHKYIFETVITTWDINTKIINHTNWKLSSFRWITYPLSKHQCNKPQTIVCQNWYIFVIFGITTVKFITDKKSEGLEILFEHIRHITTYIYNFHVTTQSYNHPTTDYAVSWLLQESKRPYCEEA